MLNQVLTLLTSLAPLAAGGAALFGILLVLERRGRRVTVLLVVLTTALADATLYPDTESSQAASVFHVDLAGQSLRTTQVVILAALAARLAVHGVPRDRHRSGPLWIAFFAWIVVSAVVGVMAGNSTSFVSRQAMIIVQVGGAMLLAADVPVAQLVRDRAMERFFFWCAMAGTTLASMDLLGIRVTTRAIPLLPLSGLGTLGADAATLYSCVGFLALALGLVTTPAHAATGLGRHRGTGPRTGFIVLGLLMILAHLATPQRAARLGVYVSLLVLLVLLVAATGRARGKLNAVQAGTALAAVAAAVLFGVLAAAAAANSAGGSPEVVSEATGKSGIGFTTRQGSIDSRFNQWDVAKAEIAAAPVFGHGLGGQALHYDEGSKSFVQSDISHNIALDLLRRTGFVGLLLFLLGCASLFRGALQVWRRHPSDAVAGLAAAAAAAALGILAKGMVESVFEKYRLAVALGVMLGVVASCIASYDALDRDGGPDDGDGYVDALAEPSDATDGASSSNHAARIGGAVGGTN